MSSFSVTEWNAVQSIIKVSELKVNWETLSKPLVLPSSAFMQISLKTLTRKDKLKPNRALWKPSECFMKLLKVLR